MEGTMSHQSFANAGDLNLLLVDDNIMTLNFTAALLKDFGFTKIETAGNGLEGWDKINQHRGQDDAYDIVFLDWNMPVMNGYDLLRKCRDDTELNSMAIVMVTAENQKRNILEATKAGATSYIIKPVVKDELFTKIAQVIEWKNRSFTAA